MLSESTSSLVPDIASGTAVTSCAKKPSTVLSGSALKLNLYGLSVLSLVIPSDISTAFSFNL